MFTQMTWLFHKAILQIKASLNLTRLSLDAFCSFGLIIRACPVITINQNLIFAMIRKMYLSITNFLAHITRAAHAITLVGGSLTYQKCSVLLKELIVIQRDLFEALTSMNIVRDHHNRIIHQFIKF